MSYIGNVPTTAAFPFDQFSGNGSTTAFTLSTAPAGTTSILVTISGVTQNPNVYLVAGTTLTFNTAPAVGTNNVGVLYLGLPAIVTSPVSISNGGTGATTRQAAMDALAGSTTSGQYLRGDGTDVLMSAIQATDLPNTAVTAGSYTYSSITVDSKGRLTAASNGASPSAFPATTAMMFVQTAAPTGWTKSTTHNDKALRVVSGAASSGGTTAFTTVFTNQTPTITTSGLSAGATTLTTAQMPSHTHTYPSYSGNSGNGLSNYATGGGTASGATGGGGSHTHTVSGTATSSAITLNVQYVDVIIATKD